MAPRILLAEDDANLRETLAEAMRATGWDVVAVAQGQAAVDALNDAAGKNEMFDGFVLDGLMPKMTGFDVARAVRARTSEAPIVFISGAFKSPAQQQDARDKYGCKAYLTKPFEPQRLIDALRPSFGASSSASAGGRGAQRAAQPESPLPSDGTLLENPALYLGWRAQREQHSGALELFGVGGDRARLFFFRGRCVFAQHSDPTLNIGISLIRDGVLSAELYKQACDLAVERKVGLYDVVKAEGWANDQQMRATYKSLVPKILERTPAMSGRFRYVATEDFSSILPTTSAPILESMLAGLRKATDRDLEPHVGPRRPLRLAPGDSWSEITPHLVSACGSDSLLKQVNGRATIAMMLESAGSPAERTARLRQVFLLMSTMAVQASEQVIPMGAPPSMPPQQAQAAVVAEPPIAVAARPQPPPQPQPAPPRAPLPGMGGGFQATPPVAQPPPRASAASAPAATKLSAPTIDESGDAGVVFSDAERAARDKVAKKFIEIDGKDYWAILGVKRGTDAASCKKAFLVLARDFHTDTFAGLNLGSAQAKLDHVFQSIQQAYATLTDETKRKEYEAKLSFEEVGASTDVAAILAAEGEFHKARTLVERGELAGALKIVDKILPIMPANEELLGYQAYCGWWQTKNPGDIASVCKTLEGLFQKAPGQLALKEFQGWLWLEANDLQKSRFAFKKVLEADRNHAGATRGMRAVGRKQEELDKKSSGLGKFLKR